MNQQFELFYPGIVIDESFTLLVHENTCPWPLEANPVKMILKNVDVHQWPCVTLSMRLNNSWSREDLPYFNPYRMHFAERLADGSKQLVLGPQFTQLDTTLLVRLCFDDALPDTTRELEIIFDNFNNLQQDKDTIVVRVSAPPPSGTDTLLQRNWEIPADWQLVSLPLESVDTTARSLFQDPTLRLYYFNPENGAYDIVNTLNFGKGYWINSRGFNSTVRGSEQRRLLLDNLYGIGEANGYGWNMVGAPSSSVAVSALTVTPPDGLKSIFAWDASAGYIHPTTIEPGKGYWMRVAPGTTVLMQGSALAGQGGSTYMKTVDRLDVPGMLQVSADGQGVRPLYLSATTLSSDERDLLRLPAPPPGDGFDVRTAEQSQYLFPGDNRLHIRAQGTVTLTVPGDIPRVSITVLDATGTELGHLSGATGERLQFPAGGNTTVLLRVNIRPHSGADALGSNYPNPLRSGAQTWIPYTLQQDGEVRLAVYDVLGRQVSTLISTTQPAGDKIVSWNGCDDRGAFLPAGMYVYRLETAAGVISRTLTIVR